MKQLKPTRRQFVATSAATFIPYVFTPQAHASDEPKSKNDRLTIGAIGMRHRGSFVTHKALPYGDVVALCDVDQQIAEKAKEEFGGKADLYEDYRALLDRQDIDVVIIATPDHWHAVQAIDACFAEKDVFLEKPLALTIDEGKLLCKVVKQTGRVVQVGNWRRSDPIFRQACEMVRAGRLGQVQKVIVTMGKNETGGPFVTKEPPAHLNWDMWLGQAPLVPYCAERCHHNFRWWFDYAGGQMTDWGAHFLDIAQWGLGMDDSGPVEIDSQATFPEIENGYDVPTRYWARLTYAGGIDVIVDDSQTRYGIMFEGDKGRIFVNDGGVFGMPVDQLKDNPLPPEDYKLYAHDDLSYEPKRGSSLAPENHVRNFVDCVKSGNTPISSVDSQHRTASLCHLGNLSMRLGRKLTWDPHGEQFVGDDEADQWLSRTQREPYQISSRGSSKT